MSPTPPASPDDTEHRRGRTVTVVDDDPGLRVAIERLLRASGFDVHAHDSAEAALAAPSSRRPDCLVVDLHLPAMSGLDLVDRLRRLGVTAPAVLVTAHDEARVRAEAGRRGVDRFLAKPFRGGALVGLLDELLRGTGVVALP